MTKSNSSCKVCPISTFGTRPCFGLFHCKHVMRKAADCRRHTSLSYMSENRRCWMFRADVVLFWCSTVSRPEVLHFSFHSPSFPSEARKYMANCCIPAHGERKRDSFILCLFRGESFPVVYQHCKQ